MKATNDRLLAQTKRKIIGQEKGSHHEIFCKVIIDMYFNTSEQMT
jgi:hypothetical protein